MKNFILVVTFFLFIQTINAQEKYSLGFSFGLGKNFFKNTYETDNNHFKFNKPTSIFIGTQFVKHLNSKNDIVLQFGYTNKKIQFEYMSNEPNIPYKVNDVFIEKYDVISLSIGYRKWIPFKNLKTFIEIDLVTDYNLNVAIGSKGTGKGIGEANIPLNEPILYRTTYNSNIGKKSITVGNNIAFGLNLGKKKKYDISANVNIPYNKIQSKTSNYQYQWQYNGKEYNHNLDYKGSIIYSSIKLTYYAFNK